MILEQTIGNQHKAGYKYKCLKCGYIGTKDEVSIIRGFGCPCCVNRVVIKGINDITTTDPWMIPYFQGGEDEACLYSKSCSKKIVPKCPDCGRLVIKQTINNIYTHNGVSCICKDGISFPNKIIYFVMEQLLSNKQIKTFKREFYIKEKNKYFDIYFELHSGEKFFIEMDGGIGHGEVIVSHEKNNNDNFKLYSSSMFKNDIEKEKIADLMNINLIRIDCYYSDFEYIKQNLLHSELSGIVDLSIIDWCDVEKQSHTNLMKQVCEYKRNNQSMHINEIAKEFQLSDETVRNYLESGNKLGWCVFDRKEEAHRSRVDRKYYGQSCQVIVEDINTLESIKFDSVADFIRNNFKIFKNPLTRKMVTNRFKKGNDFIENYEGYNIQKLRRNCDGIRKSS